MNINYDGRVRPCCHIKGGEKKFGNILEQSFEEIWNGPGFKDLRRRMYTGDLAGSGCENCPIPASKREGHGKMEIRDRDMDHPAGVNLQLNFDEMMTGEEILESQPVSLQFFPSSLCNIDCDFCFQMFDKGLDIGDKAYDLIRELSPRLDHMNWVGGEPTVQKQFRWWIKDYETFDNPNLSVSMVSNGTHLDQRLASVFRTAPKVDICISLDAVQKDLYEELRRGATWEGTRENLVKFCELRDNHPDFGVKAICLLQKRNLHHLPDFLEFCLERNLEVMVNPLDGFPIPMRIDMFEDPAQELPPRIDTMFEKSLELVEKRGSGRDSETYKQIERCQGILTRGLARRMQMTETLRHDFGPAHAGKLAVAFGERKRPFSYCWINDDGVMNLPFIRGHKATIRIFKDEFTELPEFQIPYG